MICAGESKVGAALDIVADANPCMDPAYPSSTRAEQRMVSPELMACVDRSSCEVLPTELAL